MKEYKFLNRTAAIWHPSKHLKKMEADINRFTKDGWLVHALEVSTYSGQTIVLLEREFKNQ
jgi:hypothetical protein